MARQIRDAVLNTRDARRRLKTQAEPHWRALDSGLHLGYRKRANGGSWIARRFTENKKYVKHKIGAADDFQDADGIKTLDFRQAQEAVDKWFKEEIRKEAGLDEAVEGHFYVKDALREYLAHYKVEGKGFTVANSITNAHILPHLGDVRVDRLTSKKITEWIQKLAAAPARLRTPKTSKDQKLRAISDDPDEIRKRRATTNRVLTILKAALNHAWKEGKVASDTAWRKVKPFRNVSAPVIRYLIEAECVRLVNATQSDFRKLVQAALFTGCRYSELTRLVVSDFNPDAATIAVRTSKSGKPRHVILTDEGKRFFEAAVRGKAGEALILAHNGQAWGKSHQSRPLAEACRNAKIEPAVSFHVLRHTHGSLLAMKGVPMPVIAKQLGHADTRMTEKHYAHLSPSYVAETIRQNFPTLGLFDSSNVVPMKVPNTTKPMSSR